MSAQSADLNWLLVRKYHSKLVKRNGLKKSLSAEAGNLPNLHTFHASGLVHAKMVDVRAAKEGNGIIVLTRKGDVPSGQIAKAVESQTFTGGKSHKEANKQIGGLVGDYRTDRKTLAVARARGILAGQRKRKGGKQTRRVRSATDRKKAAAAATKSA